MNIAKVWFEEAKKEDFRYPYAYLGLVDLYTFLGIYNKQHKKPFSHYFEKAEQELAKVNRFSDRNMPAKIIERGNRYAKSSKKAIKVTLTNRYLLGHSHFIAGLHASNSRSYDIAIEEFKKAVEYVPEDSITFYHLYQLHMKVNKRSKAAFYYKKSTDLNSCIEKDAPPVPKKPTRKKKAAPTKKKKTDLTPKTDTDIDVKPETKPEKKKIGPFDDGIKF